jgi:hypothetical protein
VRICSSAGSNSTAAGSAAFAAATALLLRDTILLPDVDFSVDLVLRILSEPIASDLFFLATVNFLPELRFSEARSIDKWFSADGQNGSKRVEVCMAQGATFN